MLVNSPFYYKNFKNMSFEEYIRRGEFPIDTSRYTDKNGNLIVDKILRYEDLNKALMAIAQQLGFNLELKANAKSGFRLDLNVTREQSRIIYEAFSSSNKYTGYCLPE